MWLLWGGMHGCSGGHAWLLWGACVVALGEGACVVAPGGCMVFAGGCAWFFPGGMRGFFWGGQGLGGMHRIRRDTVNERAVHILLECILVRSFFCW